jgi:rhodanese-related sulfurtransferase
MMVCRLGDRAGMEAVDPTELRRRMKLGDVTLLDVRPRPEFDAGHIRGAKNVPFDELEARLRELPPDVEVVAYCRGPYCVFADEAVAALSARGFKARRLTEGFPDWQARGFPVERIAGR